MIEKDVSCVIIELKSDSRNRIEEWENYIISNKKISSFNTQKLGVTLKNISLVRLKGKTI